MLTHDPFEIGFGRPSSAMLPKQVVCYRLDSRLSLTPWLYLEELGKTFPFLSRFVFLEWRRLSLSPCLVVSYSTASTREGHLILIGWWWAHKAHCCPFILSPPPSFWLSVSQHPCSVSYVLKTTLRSTHPYSDGVSLSLSLSLPPSLPPSRSLPLGLSLSARASFSFSLSLTSNSLFFPSLDLF